MPIRYGAKGTEVRQIQAALNSYDLGKGFGSALPKLAIDGIYGARTAAAVARFRAQRGLSFSGNEVDQETWKLLMSGQRGGQIGAASGAIFGGATNRSGGNNAGNNQSPNNNQSPDDAARAALEAAEKKKAREQLQQYLLLGGIGLVLIMVLTKQ